MTEPNWKIITDFLFELFEKGFQPGILQPNERSLKDTKTYLASINLESENDLFMAIIGSMAPAQSVFNDYCRGIITKEESYPAIAIFRALLVMVRDYLPKEHFEKFFISDHVENEIPPSP